MASFASLGARTPESPRPVYSGRRTQVCRRGCRLLVLGAVVLALASAFAAHERAPGVASGPFRPGGMEVATAGRLLHMGGGAMAGCLKAGETDRQGGPERAQLSALFEIMARSPTGEAVLRQARRKGVHVCIDAATDLLAYYFAGSRVVGVGAGLSEGARIAFLAHELAHVPQHPRYSDNRYFPARDLILLRRMREAAAEAIATRIAWELRARGYAGAWREKRATHYADMTRAFARAIERGAGEDEATRAAFDRWFAARWRRNVYDGMTIDHLERIASDSTGLVTPRRALSHDFLLGIGQIGTRNFLAATGGPSLTGPPYATDVSAAHAGRLLRVLAGGAREAGAYGAFPLVAIGA